MKKNSISPLKGRRENVSANQNNTHHKVRKDEMEYLYKRNDPEHEFRKALDERSSDEEHKNKPAKPSIFCKCFKNIVKFPQLLFRQFHIFNDSMEKLGFYCAAASYHYFYYSVILFASVIILLMRQNVRDARLLLHLFEGGFPMILICTSLLQTLFCLFTLAAGIYAVRTKTFCSLKIYLVFIILNILIVISTMTPGYYFAQKSVVNSYMDTYMAMARQHHRKDSKELNNFLTVVQEQFHCCGTKGPSDYAVDGDGKITFLPLSCCTYQYSSVSKADRKICYFIEKHHNLVTRRDKLMGKIVNSQGCSRRIRHFLKRRNEFELILAILLLVVLILIILCTFWFWKNLRFVICEKEIRKKLNKHKTAKKFWGHIRSRLFGKESMNIEALNILRKGIRGCSTKDQIREFLSKCTDARDLLVQEKPMGLAEDILADNGIPGLKTSLTHINVTKSEEYEAKMAGSTSVTAMHVRRNQEKILAKSRANIQTLLHEDYWIEEKGPKRRKIAKIPPVNKKCSATTPGAENILSGPCPATSSIHHRQHVHRKSLIQLQLQKHILKEQRLILAKLIGEYQEVQAGIENRKIQYAMSHRDVPIDEIIALDLEKLSEETSDLHKESSIDDFYFDDGVTVLVGPPITFIDDDLMLLEIDNFTNASKGSVFNPVKRGGTYTLIAAPEPGVAREDVRTVSDNHLKPRKKRKMKHKKQKDR